MTADGRQPHILILNDTQEILDLLQTLLAAEGYRVTTSLERMDLATITALAPDVIVQDLVFAGTQEQGWTVLSLAPRDSTLARIPAVLSSEAVMTLTHERSPYPTGITVLTTQTTAPITETITHLRRLLAQSRALQEQAADLVHHAAQTRVIARAVQEAARQGHVARRQRRDQELTGRRVHVTREPGIPEQG